MSKTLKRILAMALVICALLSYTVPAANAADLTGIGYADAFKTKVTYNFNQLTNYPSTPDGKGYLSDLLKGYELSDGTKTTPLNQRYEDQKWAYEAASTGLCGSTGENEHLTSTRVRMISNSTYKGLRISMGKDQGDWIAFRIKSPGAGTFTMKLDFYSEANAPTVAFYILEAEGDVVADLQTTEAHDTVLARQERIQTEMDPDNRIGKVNQSASPNGETNTAYIGSYTFEANKDYILVAETYKTAAVPDWYAYFYSVTFTKDGTEGEELTGEPEVGSILVEKNLVPTGEGGYMGAVQEVNGHDYFFLPLEGCQMAIYDLDKLVAGEDPLVMMVNTGLYYPTHATVTDDGKVIVGGDGKIMFIFNTKTMTGRTTPKFTTNEGLKNEGHNSSSFYNTQDGLIYIGTASGGHMARYDMQAKAFEDLGDMICQEVQKLALGEDLAVVDDKGSVKAVVCHGGFAYGLANSDNYHIIVKYGLTEKKVVGALDVTEQISGGSHSWGMTVLGDKYIIAGANGVSGLALVKLEDFSLMNKSAVTALFDSKYKTQAVALWEEGMTGHATEVIDGMQYFFKNANGMYSYNVDTGKMAYVGDGQGAFKTGAKTLVTLDRDEDGVEEQYLFSYGGGGQPRLYKPTEGKKISLSGLQVDMSEAGGSDINIGDSYNDILYIGAWNNWNCVAYDTVAEEVKSRYVTGGQTDSQVSYEDEEGNFHLVSGNYSACIVYEIDPDNKTGYGGDTDSNIIKPLIYKMKFYEQKRIHTVTAGDGHVFAGTIPDTYKTCGGVGVYDGENEYFLHFKESPTVATETTGTVKIYGKNTEVIVPTEYVVSEEFSELWGLSVQCVEYYDGRLFGTTTRSGGKDANKVDGTSAQIFVMDYENMAIEATLDLRDYLTLVDADGDGVEDPISYVGGISVDEQGRFWGLCSDVLFCFTYDKDTKEFQVKEVLLLGNSEYRTSANAPWKNRKVLFDQDNSQLFVGFYNNGMQQIVLDNWNASVGEITVKTYTKILSDATHTYALGANDNLYFASGTNLYMKPVNVADDDAAWANAQNVDAMLEALGDITADEADDVAAIKDAYNALSLREKALVQDTRFLLEAEAQVLELQIEAAINNVTAGSLDDLSALIVRYNELEADQQRIVQNYTALENAYDVAIELVDKAAEVRDQINALPDVVTLTDEAAVVAVREAYDALAEDQKDLVGDTTKLVNAEAQIILLKEAKTVREQINALPDSVTLSDEAAVVAARSAYDALTDDQKATIDTAKLEAAEAQIADLKAAQAVQEKINALPETVTLEDEVAVTAARAAYDALSDTAKAQVEDEKLVAAEKQLEELKAVKVVLEMIEALPAEVVITDIGRIKATRAAYDALDEATQAEVDITKLLAAEKALEKVKKNTAPTVQFYNFELYADPVFYTDCTRFTYDATAGRITSNFYASSGYNSTYATVADWFYGSYPQNINWGVETNYSGKMLDYSFRGESSQGMRMNDTKTADTYSTLRIFVPAAGLYQVDLKAGTGAHQFSMYAIPASTFYAAERTPLDIITGAMTTENQLLDNCSQKAGAIATIEKWNIEEPGDYILIFKATSNSNTKGVNFRNITLTPIIDETTAVAQVGEELFLSLDQAIAYQIENGAEKVSLFQNATVGDLVLESDAVLDLNGKTLTADTVLSYESSEIIDSSEKDTGVLVINDAAGNMLSSDNAQLPIYDAAVGGLRFFEVSVKSVATTGKGSENPKYWFKIDIVNFDQLYALIRTGDELDIAVKMTCDGVEAEAEAGPAFLQKWAEKYAATDGDFYITVSAVNAEGLESFSLIPCIMANGVAICGDEM